MTKDIDLDALQALADQAGGEEWFSVHHGVSTAADGSENVCRVSGTRGKYEWEESIRDYIAAANPQTVSWMIARIRELEGDTGKASIEQAAFIEVSAGVRYWEDATVNGQEDTDGRIPLRKGENWEPVIELATGRVLDWPDGVEANIHYKVCDEGEYWLLDADKRRIAKWKGYYVPDRFLCVGNNGFGDYIIFTIGRNGAIIGWQRPDIDPEQWDAISAGRAAPEGGNHE